VRTHAVLSDGYDPRIHDEVPHGTTYETPSALKFIMDGRVKPGHDS
jgi:hypothetical protein